MPRRKQEQREEQTALTRYAAIFLGPPTSLYGEQRSCRMEAPDDLGVLLDRVTYGDLF